MVKKLSIGVMALVFMLMTLGVKPEESVSASSVNASSLTEKDYENLQSIVVNSVGNDGNNFYVQSDKSVIQKELESYGLENVISADEITHGIEEYISIMNNEQGENAKNELEKYNGYVYDHLNKEQNNTVTRSACSNWITGVGFVHTSAITGAGVALGVSGPVGWAVGTGMAGLYAGGSMLC